MKYSLKVWNNDEFITEIELLTKKNCHKLLLEARKMCKWYEKHGKEFTCIDLCKNGDSYINIISINDNESEA